MQNIIITPTFIEHFQFIVPYLKSFKKYALGGNYLISFLISKNEKKKFSKIIKNFSSLSIDVLFFEDILQEFGITETPDILLRKYGKFSYQTIKKFYAMLHYGKNARFLVLDSESMLIRKTDIGELFQNFFNNPFISYSYLKERSIVSPFMQRVVNNNCFLGFDSGIWCLENFVWFYEAHILEDLFQDLGSPIEIIDKVYNHNDSDLYAGVFEIELYQDYIYKNRDKYKYKLVNIDKELIENIPEQLLILYKHKFFEIAKGNCGILERFMDYVNEDNMEYFARLFKKLNFNIVRCDNTTLQNYKVQKKFLNIVQPNILAASQGHAFGIKSTLMVLLDTAPDYIKFKKHFDRWYHPFKNFLNVTLIEPIKILTHIPLFIKDIIKIEWMIHIKKD